MDGELEDLLEDRLKLPELLERLFDLLMLPEEDLLLLLFDRLYERDERFLFLLGLTEREFVSLEERLKIVLLEELEFGLIRLRSALLFRSTWLRPELVELGTAVFGLLASDLRVLPQSDLSEGL